MTAFEEIEEKYLKIDSENYSALIDFYNNHLEYFKKLEFRDSQQTQKELWMLTEISDAFEANSKTEMTKNLSQISINLFKKYSKKFQISLSDDNYYKSLISKKAWDYLDKKRYFSSFRLFYELKKLIPNDFRINDGYNVSRFQIIRKSSIVIGLIGFILFISTILLDSIFTKFSGEFLILLSLITLLINRKPSLHNNDPR